MRKVNIILFFLLVGSIAVFAQADEAAIKKLCSTDTQAFLDRDYDTWESCWHQSDKASMLITGSGNNHQGWEAIQKAMDTYYENNSEPSKSTFSNDNFVFNIQGDQAFISFEQTIIDPSTVGGNAGKSKTNEVRNLIKVDGAWKIYNQVTSPLIHEKNDENVITHLRLASQMLFQMGRKKEGTKIPEIVADFFPDRPSGYWGMGFYAFVNKDKANALKHLEKAMSLFDGDPPPGLVELYESAKKLE